MNFNHLKFLPLLKHPIESDHDEVPHDSSGGQDEKRHLNIASDSSPAKKSKYFTIPTKAKITDLRSMSRDTIVPLYCQTSSTNYVSFDYVEASILSIIFSLVLM